MKNPLGSFKSLFIHELQDLYSAESQLVDALPSMAKAASHDDLKAAFNEHLEETETHVKRLHDILSDLGEKPGGEHCDAMEGLIQEGEGILEENGKDAVKDAALIAAAQRVEHYEIAGYGTARTYAKQLGFSDAASSLSDTLSEEKAADKKLNALATGSWISDGINQEAKEKSGAA